MGEVHARFQQAFLKERVPDLHRRTPLGAGLIELKRCERGAVNAITPGVSSDEHEAVACPLRPRAHEPVDAHQPDAHGVDERVLRVAIVEIHLAADCGYADAVAVTADAGHDPVEVMARARQRAEAQRVEQRDRPRTHRDHVPDDAAHAGRRPLVRLDGGGMVVRLDLEHRRPAFADLHGAGVLARALQHGIAGRGQPPQQRLGRLVRAMLRPQHSEHAELDGIRRPLQLLDDGSILLGREGHLPQPPGVYGSHGRTPRREIRWPGGPDARRGRAPERAHLSMRERGAEVATTQMGRMGAEDPSRASGRGCQSRLKRPGP